MLKKNCVELLDHKTCSPVTLKESFYEDVVTNSIKFYLSNVLPFINLVHVLVTTTNILGFL